MSICNLFNTQTTHTTQLQSHSRSKQAAAAPKQSAAQLKLLETQTKQIEAHKKLLAEAQKQQSVKASKLIKYEDLDLPSTTEKQKQDFYKIILEALENNMINDGGFYNSTNYKIYEESAQKIKKAFFNNPDNHNIIIAYENCTSFPLLLFYLNMLYENEKFYRSITDKILNNLFDQEFKSMRAKDKLTIDDVDKIKKQLSTPSSGGYSKYSKKTKNNKHFKKSKNNKNSKKSKNNKNSKHSN